MKRLSGQTKVPSCAGATRSSPTSARIELDAFLRRQRERCEVEADDAVMSHKSPKIDALLAGHPELPGFNRHYVGFFRCFNAQLYYEAHDILEEVWLPIRSTPQSKFYKGLIQMAGGFVHLQKQQLGPASRLFAFALVNFDPYPARLPCRDRSRRDPRPLPRTPAGHRRFGRDPQSRGHRRTRRRRLALPRGWSFELKADQIPVKQRDRDGKDRRTTFNRDLKHHPVGRARERLRCKAVRLRRRAASASPLQETHGMANVTATSVEVPTLSSRLGKIPVAAEIGLVPCRLFVMLTVTDFSCARRG